MTDDLLFDTSVIVKWVLFESDTQHALDIFNQLKLQGGTAYVLDIAIVEATNAIGVYHKRGLISEDLAKASLRYLETVPVTFLNSRPLLQTALELAIRFRIAVYDALLVAAMVKRQCETVTADIPLVKTVAPSLPCMKLLKDFVLTSKNDATL